MPTTSNFGWTTPADTDLVKDGAAAIRTLGNNIDASLVDLKGGTTGQVLSKASNTDLDFTWTNGGDITEVTAGTGLSGGGTSGAITLTNTVATTFDAKGDLVVGTGADTFAKLPVGTNGLVLTTDSGETTGLKWAAATTTFAGCSVYRSSGSPTQTIANNTTTAVAFTAEHFDTNSYHDNVTNNTRITIPAGKAGYYAINSIIGRDNNTTGNRLIYIYKNGANVQQAAIMAGNDYPSSAVSFVLNLAVGDYVEIFVRQNSGSDRVIDVGDTAGYFNVYYLG